MSPRLLSGMYVPVVLVSIMKKKEKKPEKDEVGKIEKKLLYETCMHMAWKCFFSLLQCSVTRTEGIQIDLNTQQSGNCLKFTAKEKRSLAVQQSFPKLTDSQFLLYCPTEIIIQVHRTRWLLVHHLFHEVKEKTKLPQSKIKTKTAQIFKNYI